MPAAAGGCAPAEYFISRTARLSTVVAYLGGFGAQMRSRRSAGSSRRRTVCCSWAMPKATPGWSCDDIVLGLGSELLADVWVFGCLSCMHAGGVVGSAVSDSGRRRDLDASRSTAAAKIEHTTAAVQAVSEAGGPVDPVESSNSVERRCCRRLGRCRPLQDRARPSRSLLLHHA